MTTDPRRYLIDADGTPEEVGWSDLAEVNDAETMAQISALAVGEHAVIGMCDQITRTA